MAMNVNSLVLPTGENGKFKVGARSKYYKTLKRLFGEKAAEYARSPKSLKGKVLIASSTGQLSHDESRESMRKKNGIQ